MYCPHADGECKTAHCMFWLVSANACSRVLDAAWNAEGYLSSRDDRDLGLLKVNRNLGSVLTRGLMASLSRDPNFSNSDRELIKKLVAEKERLESLKGFKR